MPDPRAIQEAHEELYRIAAKSDPLAEMMRDHVGEAVRLHIPLRDAPDLKKTATVLRALASRLEVESMSRDPTAFILGRAWTAVRAAQFAINPDYGKKNKKRKTS